MKKFRRFNEIIWKSMFSLSYYREILKAPLGFSMKFYWVFSLFVGLLITISLTIATIPIFKTFGERAEKRIFTLYPQDLIITAKEGKLTTNMQEPLRFPIPFELVLDNAPAISDQQQLYLITIDTRGDPATYKDQQSFIYVTENQLVLPKDDNFTTIPLKDFGDFTINQSKVHDLFQFILGTRWVILIAIAFLLLFIFALIIPIVRLIGLVIVSLLLLPISRLFLPTISYSKVFQLGLHAYILPSFIEILLLSLGILPTIPFFQVILFILFFFVILADLRNKTAVVDIQSTS